MRNTGNVSDAEADVYTKAVPELAHLGNPRNDVAFWRAVGQWLPDYDQRRARAAGAGAQLGLVARSRQRFTRA